MPRFLFLIAIIFLAPLIAFAQEEETTTAVLSAGFNLSGLQPLLTSIQQDLLPEVVLAVNGFIENNLSFTTEVGVDGLFGVRLSAGINEFVLNSDLTTVTIAQENEMPSTSSTVRVKTSTMSLGASLSSTIRLTAFGQTSPDCSIGLGAGTELDSLELSLGLSTSNSNDISIDAKEATVPSLGVTVRGEETGSACDIISDLVGDAINNFVDGIEPLVLSFLNENMVRGLASILEESVVPIAQFDTSVSVGNAGIILPSFALESISPKSNSLVVDIEASLDVELTQPEFRRGRRLAASSETTPNTMPRVSVANLLGMNLNLGTFNRIAEAAWYLGRAAFANDSDERLSEESTLCAEQAQPSDPCPHIPFESGVGFFGNILLYILFLGRGNFRVEAVLFPPVLDADSDELLGTVTSRVAILGSGLFGGERRVLATAGVDTVLSTGLPRYNGVSGVISNVELTRIDGVNFDLDYEGFPLFWFFSNIAQGLISSLAVTAANDFIDSANTEIAAFLENNPLKIPAIRKFPTARTDLEFRLVDFGFVGVPSGADTDPFLAFDGGLDLAVLEREDAPSAISAAPPARSVDVMNSACYREAYDLAMQDPNAVISRSYSTPDGALVVYTTRWDETSDQVQIFTPNTGTWSPAPPP